MNQGMDIDTESTGSESSTVLKHAAEISGALAKDEKERVKTACKALSSTTSSDGVANVLVPLLFQKGDATLKPSNVLNVLVYLSTTNTSVYLKPVARKLNKQILDLALLPEDEIKQQQSVDFITQLVKIVIQQIALEDLEVSELASQSLSHLYFVLNCTNNGASLWQELYEIWQQYWKQATTGRDRNLASTVSVRYASVAVSIMSIYPSATLQAKEIKAVDLFVNMLQYSDDPLLQISVMDVLSDTVDKLASKKQNVVNDEFMKWLYSPELLDTVIVLAGGVEGAEPDMLVGGIALRVVASLCKLSHAVKRQELISGNLLNGFYLALRNYEYTGESERLALVDAVSSFAGASTEALGLILKDSTIPKAWLNLTTAQPQLKAAIIMSVSLTVESLIVADDTNSDNVSSSCMQLYVMLGKCSNTDSTTDLLLNLAKSPLDETRLAVFALLKAVSKIPVCAQVLLSYPGFLDFVLDRSERTTDGRVAKFAIANAIYNNSVVVGLLANEIVRKLQVHVVEQGPHYVKSTPWDVALEQ